jgi:hypothetical protein
VFETVAGETPARVATSRIVGVREGVFGSSRSFIATYLPCPQLSKELSRSAIPRRLHDRLEETNVVDQLLIGEAVRGASLDCVGPRLKVLSPYP